MNSWLVRVESYAEFDPHVRGYGITRPRTRSPGMRKKVKMAVIMRIMPSTLGFILP